MRRPPYLWFAALAVATGVVDLLLTPPVAGFGDGGELMLVLARNGVAHPTGYPLYTILGHGAAVLFHGLGMGWARAAGAWSAVGAAAAVWFLALLAWRWARPDAAKDPAAARAWTLGACTVGALLLAFDPIWLEQATTAEVYTWHVAWACAAAWCALGRGREPSARAAALLGFVLGLGLAHHRSAVFLAAPLAVAWLVAAWRTVGAKAALARGAIGVAAALVPLSSFAWIAWRAFHPGPAQWPALAPTWEGVRNHLLASEYTGLLGRFAPGAEQWIQLTRFGYPVLVPGLLLVGVLAIAAWRHEDEDAPWVAAFAVAALLATAWMHFYGVTDPEAYFLLPSVLGIAALGPLARNACDALGPAARKGASVAVVVICVVGLSEWMAVGVHASLVAGAETAGKDRVARLMWQSLPDDSSLVFWPADAYPRLLAYQELDGEKRSLYVINPSLLGFLPARRTFAARFGFDPLADFHYQPVRAGAADETHQLDLLYRDLLLHVSARTPLAVYIMVPEEGVLHIVPKDRDPDAPPQRP